MDFHVGSLGGIQTSVFAQCNRLERLGHRVTLFTTPSPGNHGATGRRAVELRPVAVVNEAVRFFTKNDAFGVVLPSARNGALIDRAFAEYGPVDVVHLHTGQGAAIAGLKAARRHGIPVVQSMHGRDDVFLEHVSPAPYVSARVWEAMHRRYVPHDRRVPRGSDTRAAHHAWRVMVAQARAADHVTAPTRYFRDLLVAHGVDRPITVLSNGVDDDAIDAVRAEPAADDRPEGPLRVVWCGRLSPEKRITAAVAAVARVDGATLDIYGAGDQYGQIEDLIEATGSASRISLHGRVAQRECLAAMANADVLLLPSYRSETQCMVLLEAIAMSLPVVYCDPDLAETVPDGGGVRSGDPSVAALAETVRRLVADRAAVARMRKEMAAHRDSTRQSRHAERLVSIYTDLIR
ncbi:glycosyltransferase [Nocardia transvalensis]|uniref:glycosyltransferase n=1 Tax=Nocardia transvalensis TaxID=37333 RepID=UPI0014614008|nr:glycosyltransferase [Nocardia transvalensis]